LSQQAAPDSVLDATVRLTMTADLDNSQIKLNGRNLERLYEYSYGYDDDEFGTELLEEIGKAIIGQPHKLRTIWERQAEALAAWSGPNAVPRREILTP
jgi:hypothetical protein